MTVITLQGLSKRFGRTVAVEAVDLTIPSGELFFVLGPSGCGKTTLLRLLAGFITPTAGRIRFDDRDITDRPANKRNTGMVFQSYALWPHMTVRENVAYGLRVRKVEGAKREARVMTALRAVHMEELAARKPNELSGGQQQRIALARALVVEPDVLLLDEPLSNLDAKLRLEMRDEIRRICKAVRITTVYVTHDQKEALSLADTVAVLRDGRIMQVGSPRSLYARPGCRFVAAFLGETNFLRGEVVQISQGEVTVRTAIGPLVSAAGGEFAAVSGRVTCSIRPEAIRIVEGPAHGNAMVGRRIRTVDLGEIAQHHIRLSDGSIFKVLELNPCHRGRPDEQVHLTVDRNDVVLLRD